MIDTATFALAFYVFNFRLMSKKVKNLIKKLIKYRKELKHMSEQSSTQKVEHSKIEFQIAIKKHHLTQTKLAKFCETSDAQFCRAISGDPAKRSQEIRDQAAEILGLNI